MIKQNSSKTQFHNILCLERSERNGYNHENERRVLENYTLEQRVSTASLVIDKYLENKQYKEIILLGFSEGGYILPRIYLNLKSKERISGLAVLSAGGLSQYNSLKTLSEKDYSYPEGYKNELKRLEEVVEDIKQNPDTIDKRYLGLPYKRWSSFMFYRPLDDLLKIDIPIFMGQGEMDMMSAVDSARRVKEEFVKMNKENLTYIEYKDKGHGFNGEFETIIKDIEDWFRKEIR
ncbi:alpha/beta hydrolase [Halocella sp. SP3-1]|nr:alpha/beta hydrolase [Halocella sp. SP3-1]